MEKVIKDASQNGHSSPLQNLRGRNISGTGGRIEFGQPKPKSVVAKALTFRKGTESQGDKRSQAPLSGSVNRCV
jgi:hypothetical protein